MAQKILLVEDNELVREMMIERLLDKGFEVLTASDGEQALAQVRAAKPDLVLMDMSIPVLNGWDATQRIKADPTLRHIPVIALTAHAIAGEREKSLEAGCDEYETKPVNFPQLLAKIHGLMPKQATV